MLWELLRRPTMNPTQQLLVARMINHGQAWAGAAAAAVQVAVLLVVVAAALAWVAVAAAAEARVSWTIVKPCGGTVASKQN